MSNNESKPSKDLKIASASSESGEQPQDTKKLCDVFNNEYYSRIKAMTWEEFSPTWCGAKERSLKNTIGVRVSSMAGTTKRRLKN